MASRLHEEQQPVGYLDVAAWLVVLGAAVLVFTTFRDYGVPWDGQGEAAYGELLIKYYTSWFRDQSAFGFINLRYYGGGFELPAAILARISPFQAHETRHLISALLGVVGIAATWRLARTLGGPLAGVLAALFLLLNASWYGHAFINARDIPFGAGMACCLVLAVRVIDELPRITWRTRVLFGFAVGITVSVRVGGVLALLFLGVPMLLWLVGRARSEGKNAAVRDGLQIAGSMLQSLAIAYAVMLVLWPWAAQSPLNPLRALLMFSRFPFDAMVLFNGQLVPARALPASYLPVQFGVRAPESLLVGLCAALVFGLVALRARPSKLLDNRVLRLGPVLLAAAFPFVYFAVFRPVAYNGMRHFLFVLPPLTVLAALAFARLLEAPSRVVRGVVLCGLALAAFVQARSLVALHPDEYAYFNAFVGGPHGAQKRYEIDFWGVSLAEATQHLVQALEEADSDPAPGKPPLKVYVCGNVWSAATFFPRWLSPVEHVEDADFQVAIDAYFCKSPLGSRRIDEVTRAGALLSYVDDLRPLRSKSSNGGLVQTRAPSQDPHRRAGFR
jgi:hypothetical protein